MLFSDIDIIDEFLLKALNENEIYTLTEIQEKAIPVLLNGNDTIGLAQTGTGKTYAFSIPLLSKITKYSKNIEALILTPTRELAIQVCNEIKKLTKYSQGYNVCLVYGGEDIKKQLFQLRKKPNILIATPGRLLDHIDMGSIKLNNIKYFVLDEADEMLKMGFKDQLENIYSHVKSNPHQTALFSATMPSDVLKITNKYLKNPTKISIEKKTLTCENIEQHIYYVFEEQKQIGLIRLLDVFDYKRALIFTNTKYMSQQLTTYLVNNNYKASSLHGDMTQSSREIALKAFKDEEIDFLVCTDIAARGIDVKDLDLIINYDLPQEDPIYVHRIGRTGRAGRNGLSITFATKKEKQKVEKLEEYTKKKMIRKEFPNSKILIQSVKNRIYNDVLSNIDNELDNIQDLQNKILNICPDKDSIIKSLLTLIYKSKQNNIEDIKRVYLDFNKRQKDSKQRSNSTKFQKNDNKFNKNKKNISRKKYHR